MPRITKPKEKVSQAKTKSSQRSTRGNAATTKPPLTSPFTMTTRSKARDEAQKAQVLAANLERQALRRDSTMTSAKNLLYAEMKFEERGLRRRLGGRSRKRRRREDKRATKPYLLKLRELQPDLSALGSPDQEPGIPAPEHEPEIPPSTKGASTHAAHLAFLVERLSSCRELSHYVKTGAVTAGGVHRWAKVEA